jgi:multidrug efflux pump subunit AcrA (membrane-fusion protein)
MLIHKLKTLAAIAAASMMLIVTSLVMVSVLSSLVRSAQAPRRGTGRPPRPNRDLTPSPKPEPVEKVTVVAVKRSSFQRSTNPGAIVEPWEVVDVMPAASGTLIRLTVDIGSLVKKGDVLAEIDAPDLKKDLIKAENVVQQARARLDTARMEVGVTRSAIDEAQALLGEREAALKTAQVAVTYREKQYNRIKELVERGTVDRVRQDEEADRYETAKADAVAAEAAIATARSGVEKAKYRVALEQAKVHEVAADLGVASAKRDKAQLVVDSLVIRSPIDGFVTRRHVHAGQFVRAAAGGESTPIVTIVQTRVVRVVALVPDNDVRYVGIGDPAVFSPTTLKAPFKGKVSRVAGVEDPKYRAMRVEIDLENKDGRLRPRMAGWVNIQLDSRSEALSIPTHAVCTSNGRLYCYRVIGGRTVRTPITLEERDAEWAWVSDGLSEGDLVVADVTKVKEGEEVEPAPGGAPPPAPVKR